MPSTTLDARQITRRHGARTVLDGVTLRLDARSRLGLVGPNGAGKSTLLRVLAGLEPADAGTVERHGSVGYLPQLGGGPLAGTARGRVLESVGVAPAARQLDALAARLAGGDLAAVSPHADALERWLALGGADAEGRLAAAATRVGLAGALLDRPLAQLSGGQAAKAGLTAVAIARHDVVLLDEPTSHLDADGLERLHALIAERAGGVVVVSHDRAFLSASCTAILELDPHTGRATAFGGGWAAYERERTVAHTQAVTAHAQASAERAALVEAEREIRRRAESSARRVRHGGADGDKHVKEWVTARAQERMGRARKVGTRAARVEVPDKPWEVPPLRLALGGAAGNGVLELRGAVLAREGWRLGPLDLAVTPGERVLLTGRNGAGKSTLLAALAGRLPLAAGDRRCSPALAVAELGQARTSLLGAGVLVAAVRAAAGLDERAARAALAAYGLGKEAAARNVETLSPGERTRAELAVLGHRQAAILLLDEPTTHLDVDALETLEAALADWPGALVVATHDRRLRTSLRLEREVVLGR